MPYIGTTPTKVVSRQSANVYRYTATAGQSVFTGADLDNNVLACNPADMIVHMNGLRLESTDYTATSASVTLTTAATAGDELTVTSFVTFEVADTYTKTVADSRYVNTTGDTMTGALNGRSFITADDTSNYALMAGRYSAGYGGAVINTTSNASFLELQVNGYGGLRADSAGRVTMPYQPAFHAYSSTYTASGDYYFNSFSSSWYGRLNRGSHFNESTGVFTAPVSGAYQINYIFHDTTNSAARHIGRIFINNYYVIGIGEVAEAYDTYSDVGGGVVLNLAANDTVTWATHPAGTFGGCTASGYLIG